MNVSVASTRTAARAGTEDGSFPGRAGEPGRRGTLGLMIQQTARSGRCYGLNKRGARAGRPTKHRHSRRLPPHR